MKKALLIILLLTQSLVFVQGQTADEYFKKGQQLYNLGLFEEAVPYFERCDNKVVIAMCWIQAMKKNAELGDYWKAIQAGTKALNYSKELLSEESEEYASIVLNLVTYYTVVGNYTEAIKLETEILNIYSKTIGKSNALYAGVLNHTAKDHSDNGNYTEAIKLGREVVDIYRQLFGEQHPDYAIALNNLGSYNAKINNYSEAIRLVSQASIIWKNILGEESQLYATSLHNLAYYYAETGNNTEAIKLCSQALEICGKTLGTRHHDYIQSMSNLALYYSNAGNYSEAIKLVIQVLEQYKTILGENHPTYATTLDNLALYHYYNGNLSEAINIGTQASDKLLKSVGKNHPHYHYALSHLANYYFQAKEYDKATEKFTECFDITSSNILKNFYSMTAQERAVFWDKEANYYSKLMPYLAYCQPSTSFTTLAYNGQLFAKGLLLNAELEIQNLIKQSGNTKMEEAVDKIRNNRILLDKLYLTSPGKRPMNADSLAKVIDNDERALMESTKELGDYTKNLSVKWQDVQKKLSPKDIAIEFANCNYNGKQRYIAFIVKKGMTAPEAVKLDFWESNDVDYTSPALYNKIWKPLDKYLQDVSNVYFAPSGKFHTIAIEYLSDENGEIFAKKFNAYRLSSTREIALQHTANTSKKASVYGGIVYNFDETDWQNANEEAQRAGITFLKGAKIESEEITDILKEGSFSVDFGTDKDATEGSFKKLSGSGIKILHIATHGFYEPENKKESFADLLSAGDKDSHEDRSLSRSGLFLAGANTALNSEQRQFIPDGVDDGILTAKDISRMDFKGLDLVVLSACQTGLGEVTSEGVFGLQRGFKKAGAHTIVMSLWNVSDKPTKDLMTEFYRNLMAGKSKRDAFVSAQDKIRQKYIDPRMWAGFIMVDGME
ncbi:MAG: CHAT domain-containing protein [Bacteroidales bacterium]|nr:CHAT domain-containing protein [Bacteroidales bacterium]